MRPVHPPRASRLLGLAVTVCLGACRCAGSGLEVDLSDTAGRAFGAGPAAVDQRVDGSLVVRFRANDGRVRLGFSLRSVAAPDELELRLDGAPLPFALLEDGSVDLVLPRSVLRPEAEHRLQLRHRPEADTAGDGWAVRDFVLSEEPLPEVNEAGAREALARHRQLWAEHGDDPSAMARACGEAHRAANLLERQPEPPPLHAEAVAAFAACERALVERIGRQVAGEAPPASPPPPAAPAPPEAAPPAPAPAAP